MSNGGDSMLRQALLDAIEATKDKNDPISKGIYALCLDRLASLDLCKKYPFGPYMQLGGFGATFGVLLYLILKTHGLID